MPSADVILASAAAIANGWRPLAIAWHLFFAHQILTIVFRCRPSQRSAAFNLVLPLISVSVLAWLSGNPFNGTAFAALAVVLAGIARRLPPHPISIASAPLLAAGALLVLFGSVYPHFLSTERWIEYTYAAPLGLLPCPTVAAVIGMTLILNLLGSRSWSITLAAAGVAYGAIGIFSLGVSLDYGLLAGAIVLGGMVVRRSIPPQRIHLDESTRERRAGSRAA